MLLLLLACGAAPQTGSKESPAGDSGSDSSPAVPLPDGDNLVAVADWSLGNRTLLESTGLVDLDGRYVAACFGAQPLQIFDLADPSVIRPVVSIMLPSPANNFRCQHVSTNGEGVLLVSHHGDETSPPWVAAVDVQDPTQPVVLGIRQEVAVERHVVVGEQAWVAAHGDGLLRFDLGPTGVQGRSSVAGVTGNVYSVAWSGSRLAVGNLDGDVFFLDDGVVTGQVTVPGGVRDLLWLADGGLVAALGSSGLALVKEGALERHVETVGSALDLALLSDGSIAVASWVSMDVFSGNDLSWLGSEDPGSGQTIGSALVVEPVGGSLLLGEWSSLQTYSWNPGVSAPELRLDRSRIDLGDVAAGEEAAATLVFRNDGPKSLKIEGIAGSDAGMVVDRTTLEIPAGGADFVELRLTANGQWLEAKLSARTNDPDEGQLSIAINANRSGAGIGDPVPAFTYADLDNRAIYDSRSLGKPALLSYFATF